MQQNTFQLTAARYFQRFEHFNAQHNYLPPPHKNLRQAIVIPAFAEELSATMQSLGQCKNSWPEASEVLLVLNNSVENAETALLHRQQAKEWEGQTLANGLAVHVILADHLAPKHAGVGLARKIGMDLALQRLAQISHDGFIVCLDADCTVSSDYLDSLLNFEKNEWIKGMSLHFEHDYQCLSEPHQQRIIDYELWLRYYVEALRFAQYPHAFHTVGSSMLSRASAYAKIGGMNRRKAGEDFYFLHKLMPQGGFRAAHQPVVYPSARISTRVPFGTGRAMLEQESGRKDFSRLYHPQIFEELKEIHEALKDIYEENLPAVLNAFLSEFPKLKKGLVALRSRSHSAEAFSHNFYHWWDGFKVLQYVHYRQQFLPDLPSAEACKILLNQSSTGAQMLENLRALEIERAQAYL